jgi:hypothetical protein
MRWAGYVEGLGKRETRRCCCQENQRERDHYEDQGAGGWILLRWILDREFGEELTRLIWLKIGTSGELL